MIKKVFSILAAFVLLLSVAKSIGIVEVEKVKEFPVPPEKVLTAERISMVEDSFLIVKPMAKHLRIKAGEEKEFEVLVKNIGNKTIVVEPKMEIPTFAEYIVEPDWIDVEPERYELKAKEEKKFKFRVKVPDDAERGYYTCIIRFANESKRQMFLNIDVWKPPSIMISPKFIHDKVEAGKSYEYEITVENRGRKVVKIDPKVYEEERYCYGEGCPKWIEKDWIDIESPSEVQPNSEAKIKVKVRFPEDARGFYETVIFLNADDESLKEWEQRIHMSFRVYVQPKEPYAKRIIVEKSANVYIEIEAWSYGREWRYSREKEVEKPSIELSVEKNGEAVDLVKVEETEIVHVSTEYSLLPPWEKESSQGLYTEISERYRIVYLLKNASGEYVVKVLPKNVESFELKIEKKWLE